MPHFYRIAALAAALTIGLSLFTACGSTSSTQNMDEDELPYGATMRTDKTSYSLPVTYDRRFLNEAQVTAVTDYLAGVQNCDTELYLASTLQFYVDYQFNEVYEGSYDSMDAFVAALNSSIAENTADDFTFSMITIDEFTTEQNVSGLATMLELLDNINEGFSDTVENCWSLEVEWVLSYNGGEDTLAVSDQRLFLVEVDGAYYCIM
jgi:hypothetical protein